MPVEDADTVHAYIQLARSSVVLLTRVPCDAFDELIVTCGKGTLTTNSQWDQPNEQYMSYEERICFTTEYRPEKRRCR